MTTIKNFAQLVDIIRIEKYVYLFMLDLEFDLSKFAQSEREVNGYVVKDYQDGISIIEGRTHLISLTTDVEMLVSCIDDFRRDN